MLCHEGVQALRCFIVTSVLIVLDILRIHYSLGPWTTITGIVYIEPAVLSIAIALIIILLFHRMDLQIGLRSAFLGLVFGVGLALVIIQSEALRAFGLYAMLMAHFHFSEYVAIAWTNPQSLSLDSFMLNHSIPYAIAAICSWSEFFLEYYFFPEMKSYLLPILLGGSICVLGEFLRKLAIYTANSNFNHLVQFEKSRNHELITHGIYSFFRHPSYVGWFMWSVGTQIVLLNPVCIVCYAIVSWRFFHARIFMEEIALLNFFGEEYYNYQQRVPTGIPFIRGYVVQHNVPSPK